MAKQYADREFRNWILTCVAVKCVRDGLIPLVEKYCGDHYDGNIQHVRSVCKLAGYTCNQCDVKDLEPFHKGRKPCKHKWCGCKGKNTKKCRQNGACGVIYDQIQAHHTTNDPNWSNTNCKLWSTTAWEQMKCYINTSGFAEKTSIHDADVTALTQICLNYTPLKQLFGENVGEIEEVRSLRNKIFHSSTMRMSANQKQHIISQLISFLKLSVFKDFQSDINYQLEELRKLENGTIKITAETERAVTSEVDDIQFGTITELIKKIQLALVELRHQITEETNMQHDHMKKYFETQLEKGTQLKAFDKNLRSEQASKKEASMNIVYRMFNQLLDAIRSDELREIALEDISSTVLDSKVTILTTQIDEKVEGIMTDKMLNVANGIILDTTIDPENEELKPPLIDGIKVLQKDGNEVRHIKRHCVEINLESPSLSCWMKLCDNFFNGKIAMAFQPLQRCLRTHAGCTNLTVEIRLDAYYFVKCIEQLTGILRGSMFLLQKTVQKEISAALYDYDNSGVDSIDDFEIRRNLDVLAPLLDQEKIRSFDYNMDIQSGPSSVGGSSRSSRSGSRASSQGSAGSGDRNLFRILESPSAGSRESSQGSAGSGNRYLSRILESRLTGEIDYILSTVHRENVYTSPNADEDDEEEKENTEQMYQFREQHQPRRQQKVHEEDAHVVPEERQPVHDQADLLPEQERHQGPRAQKEKRCTIL